MAQTPNFAQPLATSRTGRQAVAMGNKVRLDGTPGSHFGRAASGDSGLVGLPPRCPRLLGRMALEAFVCRLLSPLATPPSVSEQFCSNNASNEPPRTGSDGCGRPSATSKTVEVARLPWVRIPSLPPLPVERSAPPGGSCWSARLFLPLFLPPARRAAPGPARTAPDHWPAHSWPPTTWSRCAPA